MPQIMLRQSVHFINDDPKSVGPLKGMTVNSFASKEVPEWITNSDHYKLLVADGKVVSGPGVDDDKK